MDFRTKFNLNDMVVFMNLNKITEGRIIEISISAFSAGTFVTYKLKIDDGIISSVSENHLFKSKKALVADLIKPEKETV